MACFVSSGGAAEMKESVDRTTLVNISPVWKVPKKEAAVKGKHITSSLKYAVCNVGGTKYMYVG